MTIIKVKCTDQVLTFENTPIIASGGLNEDFVQFSFCGKWDGYARTAVFWRTEDDAYHVVLDENDRGQIPPEVIGQEGLIYFGAFGVNADGVQRTTEVLTYRIVKGTITAGTKPSEPTQEIYTQLLADYAEVLNNLHTFNEAVQASADAATAAQAAAETAQGQVARVETSVSKAQTSAKNAETAAGAAQTAAENAAASAAAAAPATHASQHKKGGSDPLTAADIDAAPAGYGLGEEILPLINKSELDNAFKAGWYKFYDDTNKITVDGVEYQHGLVLSLGTGRSHSSFCAQIMIPYRIYTNPNGVLYRNGRYSSPAEWSEWRKLAHAADIPKTAADVGALDLTGGTLTGSLSLGSGYGSITAMQGLAQFVVRSVAHDETNRRILRIYEKGSKSVQNALVFIDDAAGKQTVYDILHTGNVTAGTTDITAGSSALATGAQYLVYE